MSSNMLWLLYSLFICTFLLRTVDQQLLSAIIDLLYALWFTILGQKEKQMMAAEKRQSSVKYLPLPLINDFLCVALTISRQLR